METGLVEVLDEVYTAADNRKVTVLIGLDLSAAFDTVDTHSYLEATVRVWGDRHTAVTPTRKGGPTLLSCDSNK